jgi:chromate transport protein ChrA
MNGRLVAKPIIVATLICGTLDILWAMILTIWRGREIAGMLRFVASGPFPNATDWGAAGAVLGLITHFTLMAIMVTVFVLAVRRWPALLDRPWVSGLINGLITYVVMNLIVVPLRFHTPLPPSALSVSTQLFAHIVLVGWPTAFVSRRYLRG